MGFAGHCAEFQVPASMRPSSCNLLLALRAGVLLVFLIFLFELASSRRGFVGDETSFWMSAVQQSVKMKGPAHHHLPSADVEFEHNLTSATSVPYERNASSVLATPLRQGLSNASRPALPPPVAREGKGQNQIIAFSDFGYSGVALTWSKRMHALGYDEVVLMATDKDAFDRFKRAGHPVELSLTSRGNLWRTRLEVLQRKLEAGFSVLLTDVDNIFMRYVPLNRIGGEGWNAAFMEGSTFPPEVYKVQGFVLCAGMSWWSAASPLALDMVRRIRSAGACGADSVKYCNDQREINRLVLADGFVWTKDQHKQRLGSSAKTGMKIVVWGRDFAWRGRLGSPCPDPSRMWAVHPISAKTSEAKVKSLAAWKKACPVVARIRPDFFILGTRKGGTTSFHTYLTKHPRIYPFRMNGGPQDGEAGGQLGTAGYQKLFNDVPADQLVGDSTVSRLMNNIESLKQYSDRKMFVLLRDPVERCHSEMLMRARLHSAGMNQRSNMTAIISQHADRFEDFLEQLPLHPVMSNPEQGFRSSKNCLYEGAYVAHLRRLFAAGVPKNNVQIHFSEDFFRNTEKTMDEAFKFLGLEPQLIDPAQYRQAYNGRSHDAPLPSNLKLSDSVRRRTLSLLEPYNKELEIMLNTSLPWYSTPVGISPNASLNPRD